MERHREVLQQCTVTTGASEDVENVLSCDSSLPNIATTIASTIAKSVVIDEEQKLSIHSTKSTGNAI